MQKQKPERDLFATYIATIKNSPGTRMFRNLYVKHENKKIDVFENGRWACAGFASSVLALFNLIDRNHATITSTLEAMKKAGWYQIKKPKMGTILVWEVVPWSEGHKHMGFYIGDNKAVSNSDTKGTPVAHHWTFGQKHKRKIESIWWNDKLN